MGRRKNYAAPYYPTRSYEPPAPPPPKPLEYQLVDLLGDEGIGEDEIAAVRTVLLFAVQERKREAVAREESEIAALKHDLQRSMSRENCYLNALMRICNNEENPAEIAAHAMYGEGAAATRAFEEQLTAKAVPGETRDHGDVKQAQLVSGAVAESETPTTEGDS